MTPNLNPDSELIADDELRAALHSHRIDAAAFEAGVRTRLRLAEAGRAHDPLANAPPLLKVAAALLPTPFLTGGKGAAALAGASGFNKLLAYAALPAVSLFVLPAAAVFGAAAIRDIQRRNIPAAADREAERNASAGWALRHQWQLWGLYGGSVALSVIGATSLMLLLYLISLIAMLYALSSFAKIGLGNRGVIAQSCLMGLMLLGQISGMGGIGDQDIHVVDQTWVVIVFFGGVLALIPFVPNGWIVRRPFRWVQKGLPAAVIIVLIGWVILKPLLWRATPERIKSHVEAFDKAPFSTSSWQQWEIVADWAIESKLDPDLSRPRRLLAEEIDGEQNPFILGNAFRAGLVSANQVGQLRSYDERRHSLLDDPYHLSERQPILSLAHEDWVIRASALRGDLTPRDRDFLEKRLHINLAALAEDPYGVLETALRATQLLEVIQRPIDRARFRGMIHDLLRKFHSTNGGGFQLAGGFKTYLPVNVGSEDATAYAVQLMEIYGVPDGLDLNWVRSFLRPRFLKARTEEAWINAVTLDRLNHLPGATYPTWFEVAYYERSLIMAVLLVALCLYATFSSPRPGGASAILPNADNP